LDILEEKFRPEILRIHSAQGTVPFDFNGSSETHWALEAQGIRSSQKREKEDLKKRLWNTRKEANGDSEELDLL